MPPFRAAYGGGGPNQDDRGARRGQAHHRVLQATTHPACIVDDLLDREQVDTRPACCAYRASAAVTRSPGTLPASTTATRTGVGEPVGAVGTAPGELTGTSCGCL